MVGHHFIDQLNKANNNDFDITTFSDESRLAYNRVMLTSYFTGNSANNLALATSQGYDDQDVEYFLNDEVIAIDREQKILIRHQEKLYLTTSLF